MDELLLLRPTTCKYKKKRGAQRTSWASAIQAAASAGSNKGRAESCTATKEASGRISCRPLYTLSCLSMPGRAKLYFTVLGNSFNCSWKRSLQINASSLIIHSKCHGLVVHGCCTVDMSDKQVWCSVSRSAPVTRITDYYYFANLRHMAKCFQAVHSYWLPHQVQVLLGHGCLQEVCNIILYHTVCFARGNIF